VSAGLAALELEPLHDAADPRPHPVEPAGICAEYPGGARRYGLAIARGVFG